MSFELGDVVRDTEDPDWDPLVVVNLPRVEAAHWIAYDETTVAEDNPDYPGDDLVAVCVYKHVLDDRQIDWPGLDTDLWLAALDEEGTQIPYFSFPRSRLRLETEAAEAEVRDPGVDLTPIDEYQVPGSYYESLYDLRDRLIDGDMDVTAIAGQWLLHAEKGGQEYQLRPGEVVAGDGILRPRLEDIVQEFSPTPETTA